MNRRTFIWNIVWISLLWYSWNLLKDEEKTHYYYVFAEKLWLFEEEINRLIYEYKLDSDVQIIKKRSNEKTKTWETYLNYAINFYKNTEYVSENKNIKILPRDVKNLLSWIVPWIIAQESRFYKYAKSSAWAVWSTQIIPKYSKFSEEELLSSFSIQVKESFRIIEEKWTYLEDNIDFKKLAIKYWLWFYELDNFITLCLINSYNTWQWRMVLVIKKFLTTISKKYSDARKDKTWEWLFNLMIELAYNLKWVNWYRIQSFEYTKLCLWFAKLLWTWKLQESLSYENISNEVSKKTDYLISNSGFILSP
jgi:hypothetical protein